MKPHPNRLAATLAQRAQLPADAWEGPFQQPAPGSVDARIDVKLACFAATAAVRERGTAAAEQHLARLAGDDLYAGTVQDGTARGLLCSLEEVVSLCRPERSTAASELAGLPSDPTIERAFSGKELRRKKDILVSSGGARVRFSRKGGVLFVDRARDLHLEDCLRFEDRRDAGTLDGFVPDADERARLFSPAFLTPVSLEQGAARDRLVLEGRLGRGPSGHPCVLWFEGRRDEDFVRLTIRVRNDHDDHRLRIRFLGTADASWIQHAGTPGWESVEQGARRFVAATIVRACGRLLVGERVVAVPAAQCRGWIEHRLRLGGPS